MTNPEDHPYRGFTIAHHRSSWQARGYGQVLEAPTYRALRRQLDELVAERRTLFDLLDCRRALPLPLRPAFEEAFEAYCLTHNPKTK